MADQRDADDLADRAAGRLDGRLADIAGDLARVVVRRHPFGLPHDPGTRADVVAEGARLIAHRERGSLALRIYTPDSGAGTMIAVVTDDAPFIMSSIGGHLERAGLPMVNHAYPEFGVVRSSDGTITGLCPARGAEERQTWIHIELARRLADDAVDGLEGDLRQVLGQVRAATGDFDAMRARVDELAAALAGDDADHDEVVGLLRWLADDHFIFLGAVDYDHDGRVVDGSALGVLRDQDVVAGLADPTAKDGGPLTVALTARRSIVDRHERMVDLVVHRGRDGGPPLQRLVGLFAKKATSEPVTTIPVLRRWVRDVAASEDIVTQSHDERMLRSVVEALPKDALFIADADRLADVFDALVRDERRSVRVVVWDHPPSDAVVVVVALPRARFDPSLRARIDEHVGDRFDRAVTEPFVGFHEDQVLLTYVVAGDRTGRGPDTTEAAVDLREQIVVLSQTWSERVITSAPSAQVAGEVAGLVNHMPATYRDAVPPSEAVDDCRQLAALTSGEADVRMAVMFTERAGDHGSGPSLRCKLYRRGPAVELSRFVPILESLGLVVVESVPHVLTDIGGGEGLRIHDYGVRLRVEADFHVGDDGRRLADAAQAVWAGEAEADSLNQLVLLAGLHWRDVAVIRAYRQFRRQVGTTFSAQFQNDALCEHPEIARALMEYFVARFRPGIPEPEERMADSRQWLLETLEQVNRLDQDRILRGYLELIDATVRTNRYRRPRRAQLAFKFDSERISDLPKPVPYREIFIYSPRMEGIHLRGGPVARGGVRWSDRQEDFRTEVLGLMKAQMVKNAVIVPTGSKGGFVLKRAVPAGDVKAEVRRQYECFIRGLLDLTDTIADGVTRHPADVRCHDGDDPYLVVAADRGTAALSDVANALSEEYGFWLGDAFASGGSRGYDHKDMGITARGAWVAVTHHFRELGIDVQTEPITVVGIGDMSGDVFGNGMLRSRALKLVAAFDHRDIMIDPDPDPVASFAERHRLFDLPGATWKDYGRSVLSEGGGVWSRASKRIELSKPVRTLLRTEAESLTPPELIRALLRAPVDLLFAGGIGTFVKASSERDSDVGDRANDAIRINGDEVGARVIGEGGNLAVTQRGRMQYARRGGRINLDAIDNAAGVDTSDREVNLKILLGQAIDAGKLDRDERDGVLAAVTDDVGARVLDDVAAQTRLLSAESAASVTELDSYEQLMVDLEGSGRLDRSVEALPDTDEVARRQQAGGGLTRPELGLLVGYAKSDLAARLAGSGLPSQRALRELIERYFPDAIVDRFGSLVGSHRLRDQLVATLLANDLVNHQGVTFVSRTVHQIGCGPAQVAGAYWIARQVSGAEADWQAVDAYGADVEPGLLRDLRQKVTDLVATYTRRASARRLPNDLQARIERDRAAFVQLEDVWPSDPPPGVAAQRRELIEQAVDAGVDQDLVRRVVTRPDLAYVPDIADVADERDRPVEQVAAAFVEVGRELPLERFQETIERLAPEGRWEQWEQKTLLDELHGVRRLLARQAIDAAPEHDGDEAVRQLLDDRTLQVERVWSLLAEISGGDAADMARVSVTMSSLRAVLD